MKELSGTRRELIALFVAIFLAAGGVIWIRTLTVKDTYLYVQKEKEFRRLEQDIQASRVHWLRLTTPKRLEMLAHNLGMFPPTMNQELQYEPEKGVDGRDAR